VNLEMPAACATAGNICATAPTGGFGNVAALAAGDRHRLIVRSDGSLWSSGMNECGQLGRAGASGSLAEFRQVPGMSGIVAVAAGMRSSMALDAKGTVFSWGNLSNPLFSSSTSAPAAGNPYCPYQERSWAGHTLSGARDDYPREVGGLPPIERIASYYASNLALDAAGQVWGWGYNSCGQLGVDPGQGPERIDYYLEQPRRIDGLPPVRAIAAGKRHSLALDGNGQVWAWGENADTELGQRLDLSQHGSPACGSEYGRGELAPFTALPRQVPGIGKAVAIAAGYNSSAAIDEHGDVWVWGRH
jgi:alpha-tubulin suppressor-like RCC1 family protein